MENGNAQNLAERIALLLQENERRDGDALHSALEKINQRLDKIEAQIASQDSKFKIQDSRFKIQNSKLSHPSQEKFKSLEEIADEILANLEEKACPYEPTAKPCDHCSMCNSRGF